MNKDQYRDILHTTRLNSQSVGARKISMLYNENFNSRKRPIDVGSRLKHKLGTRYHHSPRKDVHLNPAESAPHYTE